MPTPRYTTSGLIAHDTDPADISGTGLPMREIEDALHDNLEAERVVIIADTCHSAAIGGGLGRRAGVSDAAVVNRYLQQLSQTKAGTALLTSARANETSAEDERWGGGHGVFTHYLLEGLAGKADASGSGVVTVGDLFDYVSQKVPEAMPAQHPLIGSDRFDPALPLAVTGDLVLEDHARLGRCLYDAGHLLADPGRFKSAARALSEALRLTGPTRAPLMR